MSSNYIENCPQGANKQAAQSLETLYASRDMVLMPETSLVLENAAIMIDRVKDRLFARCTFRSITDRQIKGVRMEISCQDDWGNTLGEPTVFHYLNLKIHRDEKLGQAELIELPDKETRKIQVSVRKVLFADGTVIDGGALAFRMPEPVLLSRHLGSEALAARYVRETTPKARYVPERGNYCWFCACGAINENAEESCHSCGCAKERIMNALNPYQLQANMLIFAQGQARHGQQQTAQEINSAESQGEPKKRRKTPIAAIIVSLILVAALGCGAVFFGIPYFNYRSACKALENGEYDKAYETFADLGDFMDSEEMANEALYEKAERALRNKKYDTAIQTFQRLGDYKDSETQVLETKYLQADQYQNDEKYKEAYELYAELGSYKDSEDELLTTILLWEEEVLDYANVLDANSFRDTVALDSDHYEMFYSTILRHLNDHEDATYWYDWGATAAARTTDTMLSMLPSTYQDVSTMQELFGLLTESYIVYGDLFRYHEALVRECWSLAFVRDMAAQDEAVCYFLESYWTTYNGGYYLNFYENSDGGTTSDHTLPWVPMPYGTKYFNIENMIYYWEDDSGHLAEVYRFEIIDYDTIDVYCYQNNQTYTLYRN